VGRRPETFLRFFEVGNVNFDGYLDLAVLRDFGAKWGAQTWWTFSPGAGTYVSNAFTEALAQGIANGLVLDAARHQIIAGHMAAAGCDGTRDIYQVEDSNRLVLIHEERIDSQPDGFSVTTRDREGETMRVTKVQPCSRAADP